MSVFVSAPGGRQRGAVLVVGLILLVVISLLGVTAYRVAVQQERMSGNVSDRLLAFEMADSALKRCEMDLRDVNFRALEGGNRAGDGMYTANAAGTQQIYETVDWTSDSAVRESPLDGARYARRPACIAEDLGTFFEPDPSCAMEAGACPEREVTSFRVTARGWGVRLQSIVTVQSYFRR